MLSDPSVTILMYFVLPVWFIAAFADWICHRATSIETASGVKESAIHALMWALGECARSGASPSRRRWAASPFADALPAAESFRYPRSWAFTLLGLQLRRIRHRPRAFPCGSLHNLGPARLHG
jgi:hypothetical protein